KRRRRRTFGACVALVVLASGAFFLSRGAPRVSTDPVAYARHLHEAVFPRGSAPRYDLLKKDAALRSEYLTALDHRSSVVRRSALNALLQSGVEVDRERLEGILVNARED